MQVCEVALKLSHDQGAASHSAIAEELGVSVSTVQRSLRRLREQGEIVWDLGPHTLRNALFYRVPGEEVTERANLGVSSESPCHEDRSKILGLKGNDLQEDVLVGREEDSIDSSFLANTNRRINTSRPRRPSILDGRITSLVEEFERYVAPRSERAITSKRRQGWYIAAERLLFVDRRSLDQVRQILAWIFDRQQGVLPSWFLCKWKNAKEFKVTRLYQVVEHWDDLVKAMSDGPSQAVEEVGDLATKVAFMSDEARSSRSEVDNVTPLSREEIDDQVNELITAFAGFRRVPLDRLDEWRRNNWTKTFEIMLRGDRRSFDEVLRVVTGLSDQRLWRWIDVSRYNTPFDIRSREYDDLVSQIQCASTWADQDEKSRPEPLAAVRSWDWEELDYCSPARDECARGSSDMGSHESIERRQRRYEERAEKNRLAVHNDRPVGSV